MFEKNAYKETATVEIKRVTRQSVVAVKN